MPCAFGKTSNAFAALASEEPDVPDSAGSQCLGSETSVEQVAVHAEEGSLSLVSEDSHQLHRDSFTDSSRDFVA